MKIRGQDSIERVIEVMNSRKIFLLFCFFIATVSIYSQDKTPAIKVAVTTISDVGETPKNSFMVGETVNVKVEITNLTSEIFAIPEGIVYSVPTLYKDGVLVPYHNDAKERFEKGQYITLSWNILPNQSRSEIIDLSDYYDFFKPGQYQLFLERQFFKDEAKINIPSNTVSFEVIPTIKPELRVIISAVSVSGEDETTTKNNFKLGEDVKVKVEITNLSTKSINVPKGVDYSRPTLFRDGQLVPYRKEITDREHLNYRSVTGVQVLKPDETLTEILNLNEYYELLIQGKYRLSLQRRFFKVSDAEPDIWSNEVIFEVTCGNK